MKKLHIRKLEKICTTGKAWGMPIWMVHGFSSGYEWGKYVSSVPGNPHKP